MKLHKIIHRCFSIQKQSIQQQIKKIWKHLNNTAKKNIHGTLSSVTRVTVIAFCDMLCKSSVDQRLMILDLRCKNNRPIFQTCNLLPRLEMFESSLAYISIISTCKVSFLLFFRVNAQGETLLSRKLIKNLCSNK